MEHISFSPCSICDVYDWAIDTVSILDSLTENDDLSELLQNELEAQDLEVSDLEARPILEQLGYTFLGRENTYNYETHLDAPLIESLFETPDGGFLSLVHAQERPADVRNWGSYGNMRVYSWDYQEDRFESMPQFREVYFWDNQNGELLSRNRTQDLLDEADEDSVSPVDEQGSGIKVGSVARFFPEISF
jgi:hypothetical protein